MKNENESLLSAQASIADWVDLLKASGEEAEPDQAFFNQINTSLSMLPQ